MGGQRPKKKVCVPKTDFQFWALLIFHFFEDEFLMSGGGAQAAIPPALPGNSKPWPVWDNQTFKRRIAPSAPFAKLCSLALSSPRYGKHFHGWDLENFCLITHVHTQEFAAFFGGGSKCMAH